MADPLFSSLWYRVADVKPRLRSHTKIIRHNYRDQLWYVLQDDVAGKYHRFTPAAYYLISMMDGEKTVQNIWELAVANLQEEVPTQDETIQLLGLGYTETTDEGVKFLLKFSKLWSLHVSPHVSDKGLKDLESIHTLRVLTIKDNTKITADGLNSFRTG